MPDSGYDFPQQHGDKTITRPSSHSLLGEFRPILDASSDAQWTAAVVRQAVALGFDYVLYATLPTVAAGFDQVWVRSNYPEAWRRRYDEQGYAGIDPTVLHCLVQSLPLVWSPDIFATPAQQALYREAVKHGIRAGISLPAHGPGGRVGMLCLAKDAAPDRTFWLHVASLLPRITVFRDVVAQTSAQFLSHGPGSGETLLTPRERECLYWAAMGKTSKEIADLLHCAQTTINFHMANVRKKLAVPSRQAAVAKAIEQGLVRRL